MIRFFVFCMISLFFPLALDAALYKGQREFVKACIGCHESRQEFIITKNKKEWKELLQNNGQKLAKLHLSSSNKNAEASHDYFRDKSFVKNSKNLMQFLMEYAKDSGNVPACN